MTTTKTPAKKTATKKSAPKKKVVKEEVPVEPEPVVESEPVTESVPESSLTETLPETESQDPTVESIHNLISKIEMMEKESKTMKVELRKVLKSLSKDG